MTQSSSTTISIANDFSRYPAGRYISDGRYSAERFLRDHVLPALEKYDHLTINIDEVRGYPGTFTEETYGGLVRNHGYTAEDLEQRLTIEYSEEPWKEYHDEAWRCIHAADDLKGKNT